MHPWALGMVLTMAVTGCPEDTGVEPIPVRILKFEASPTSVQSGQPVTLTWETSGANGVLIEPTVGLQPASGTAEVKPFAATTYTLTVKSPAGDLTSQVTVDVIGGPARLEAFTASPLTIMPGETSRLDWSTTNANHVIVEPGIGMQAASGHVVVSPDTTTSYRITAIGDGGNASGEVTVVVASGNQPFVRTFTATPQTVAPGGMVTLTWETINADTVTIAPGGAQPANGTLVVTPQQSTTYTLTAVGPGGQASASLNVTVTTQGAPSVLRFDANPTTVAAGSPSTLSWETDNATHVTIEPGLGMQDAKGEAVVMPQQTTEYTLTAHGNAMTVTQKLTVTVAGANDPLVLEFSASPPAISSGGTTTLTWRTQNATSVDITPNGGMALGPNGAVMVMPSQTTTYTLTARGANTTATQTVEVMVQDAAPTVVSFTGQPTSLVVGQSATLSWQTTGATSVTIDQGLGMQPANGTVMVSPSQTTLYTLTASGPGGQTSALFTLTVTAAGAPQVVAFTAMPQQIAPGASTVLAWQTTGATSVTLDNGIGMQATNGSVTVSPPTTTTYTLSADGPGGTTQSQVTVTTISANGDQCSDAIEITGSSQVTGNTQTATGDYDPGSGGCTGWPERGRDVVYRVSMQAGDRLQATLTPVGPDWDSALYLVRNCQDVASSCVAGQDNGSPEQIDYTSASGGDFFLIVDGYGNAGGPYNLDINLAPAPIGNDQCAGAIDATMGGNFSGTTSNAMNDYDPRAGGCAGAAQASGDVTYSVTLAAGERLQATLAAAWDASLYVVTDCSNVPATCVAGQDDGNPEEVDFTAPGAGTYFIIVDGYATGGGSFDLAVVISPPVAGGETCGNAVAIPAGGGSFSSSTVGRTDDYQADASCAGYTQRGPDQVYATTLAAGDVVEVETEFDGFDGSVYVVTDCSAVNMTCVAGSDRGLASVTEEVRFVARDAGSHFVVVDAALSTWSGPHDLTLTHYTGETCDEAPPLQLGSQPEWFTTTGRNNDYSPNAGGCTGYSANAEDRAYSVHLEAGQQLQASVAPEMGYDPSVYLVSDCGDVPGSCIAGQDRVGGGSETLTALVQQTGTYYLMLDGFNGSDGAGTLTATIASGDTCGDAYAVVRTGTYRGTTSSYSNDYGTTERMGSCTNYEQAGSDAVFRVVLAAGVELTASVTANWDSALYLINDCAASATSCLAGSDASVSGTESITYTNTGSANATYYLIVDSWRSTHSGNYSLTIAVN